ncbi:MAG: ferritin family protein [Desulfobacterales bacterium]|nr:MAG: ferritin family protein [Desulfobacterales bacterium]
MFSVDDIIDLAIQIEQNAEKVYRNAQKRVSDASLSPMLQWLADEESEHAKWFARLRREARQALNHSLVQDMGKALLSEVLGSQSFSLKDADFSEITEVHELLWLAIEFEKDKVMFYGLLRPFIEDQETLDFLDKIIDEENRHIQELHLFLDSETQESPILSESS